MKYKFSRTIPYIPEWNGNRGLPAPDQIKVTIKPLTVEKLLLLMDALGDMKDGQVNNTQIGAVLKEVGHLLPEHIGIVGLEDTDGPVNVQDIITFPAYMGLATELLMQMASASMPTEGAEGNSERPPAA